MEEEKNFVGVLSTKLNFNDVVQSVISPNCGAVSTFIGTTRDNCENKKVLKLVYEAYVSMAVKEMHAICEKIREKWNVEKIAMYHRLGEVPVTEASIIIAISSPHREESLKAVEFAINSVKTSVPIWKKEIYENEESQWKENRECDWTKNGNANTEDVTNGNNAEGTAYPPVNCDSSLINNFFKDMIFTPNNDGATNNPPNESHFSYCRTEMPDQNDSSASIEVADNQNINENHLNYSSDNTNNECTNFEENTSNEKKQRKRKNNPDLWIDVQAKKARILGLEGIGRKNVKIPKREMRVGCPDNCRKRCRQRVTEDDRKLAFNTFWNVGSREGQWRWLKKYAQERNKVSNSKNTERTITLLYTLPKENNECTKVCKTMFLDTLDISDAMLRTAISKKGDEGDRRGKHSNRTNKTNDSVKDKAREHMASYPVIDYPSDEGQSTKMFLEKGLNISKMYREYTEKMKQLNETCISHSVYSKIFHTEYNYGFIPKKIRKE